VGGIVAAWLLHRRASRADAPQPGARAVSRI
jgi:hypothetical protein